MELKSYDGKNFLNTWNVNEERNITRVSKETLQAVRTEDEEISPASVKFSGSSKKWQYHREHENFNCFAFS